MKGFLFYADMFDTDIKLIHNKSRYDVYGYVDVLNWWCHCLYDLLYVNEVAFMVDWAETFGHVQHWTTVAVKSSSVYEDMIIIKQIINYCLYI